MNSVISCSVGNVSHIPGTAFSTRKNNSLTILSLSRKAINHGSSTRRLFLRQFVSSGLISQKQGICSFHERSRIPISTTETEVAVEERGSPVAEEDSPIASGTPSDEVGVSEDVSPNSNSTPAPAKSGHSRSVRKSEMPPIKNEDLIPGATFTGKVKSIQPFGAFVDFGAFTDGLIHVSRLSDSYVKDVASVVSVGQVKVKLIEVNTETQHISLSMRESDDIRKLQQKKDEPIGAQKAGSGRRNTSKPSPKKNDVKKSTKFVKGQDLEGTEKNMTRSCAFISLPNGEEGFLPISKESNEGFGNVMGTSSLQVRQEVSVRVLCITRGQETLTMKKEEDYAKLDSERQGVVHVATNPFVLAFHNNKDIAVFLDERMQKTVEKPSTARTSEDLKETVKQVQVESALDVDVPDVQEQPESTKTVVENVPSSVKDNSEDDISEIEVEVGSSTLDNASKAMVYERDPVSNISSPMTPEDDVSICKSIY